MRASAGAARAVMAHRMSNSTVLDMNDQKTTAQNTDTQRRVRRWAVLAGVLLIASLSASEATAGSVKKGGSCARTGSVAVADGWSYTCAKVNGKKVWKRTARVADGVKCAKKNAKTSARGWDYTCVKKGSKLVWKKKGRTASTTTTAPTTRVIDSTLAQLSVPQTVGSVRAGNEGPAVVRVVLKSSTDGVTFTGREVLMDQAGVPNLLAARDGRLFAYYQDWANGNIMGVAVREAGSTTWKRFKVRVDGIDVWSNPNGVDPSAVELADGRVRLFWMSRLGGNRIYSATSTLGEKNGVVFSYDGAPVFETSGEIFDPTVVRTQTGWSMWVDVAGAPVYATSTDGARFTQQLSNSPFANPMTFPWGATMNGSKVRVLASLRGAGGYDGVLLESSDNGGSFTEVARNVLPSGALGDTGIAYDTATATWFMLVSERM